VIYVWLKTKGTDILTETFENTENSSEIFHYVVYFDFFIIRVYFDFFIIGYISIFLLYGYILVFSLHWYILNKGLKILTSAVSVRVD